MSNLPISSPAPTARQVAETITRTFRSWRDPQRAEGVQRYFKNTIVSLGLRTPTVRSFVRDQVQSVKPHWGAEDALECCDRLLSEPEMEIRGAGILILGAFHKQLTADMLDQAQGWLEHLLDNWALVDTFCGSVLSPMLARDRQLEKKLRTWSRARTLWVRRAALVTLVPFARKGLLLDTAYELAREHFADREDLIHKAMGWLLREAGKTNPTRLKQFLITHGADIPRTTVRYAIERFPSTERKEMLGLTRARFRSTPRAKKPLPGN